MKKKYKIFMLASIVALSAIALAGCGNKAETNTNATKELKILHVGTNATYVPFEFVEGGKDSDKTYKGFDMELSEEIAKRLGMKLEINNTPFDGLIMALQSKKIDMIASGMVITPERSEKVTFIPYYDSGLGILVNKNITDVNSVNDLKGKRVAVQMGTTGSVAAHKIEGIAEIREFDHNAEALLELKQGNVDAVLTAIPVAKYYLKTVPDSNAKLVESPITKQTLGLGINKDDKELTEKVQKAFNEIKADGTYDKLMKKWFE